MPVVRGIDPPEELFEIDPAKIVGLTIGAERLADIRTARVKSMGASRKRYAELEAVYSELEEASQAPQEAPLPGDRRDGALGGGDGHAHHPAGRAASAGSGAA